MSATEMARRICTAALGAAFATFLVGTASSQSPLYRPIDRDGALLQPAVPQTDQPSAVSDGDDLPAPLRRQVVSYPGSEPAGTVIIDTAHTFLYLTLGGGRALRYGIGVGRKGFTWSGVETISRKSEWPDWIPPADMIARQPYLPRWVGGGPGNPLGARALYLGNTDYRIHGTNNPRSIGQHVSSGCIRMRDADVTDLYDRVGIGTKVVVLSNDQRAVAIEDRQDVAVERSAAGTMTARISVRPAVAVTADVPRPRTEWTGNPHPFGLY
jgi:lipoprotein-anchoring transpeptidase ErfK/SrfK